MKKIYFFSLLFLLPFVSRSQCLVQVVHTDATCNGSCDGTANAYPGGTGPYTYLWAPGGQTTQSITGLCAGTYTCTITDANLCTATSTFTVTQPAQLFCAATVTQQASCSSCCDGTGIGTVSGGNGPYTAMWSGPSVCTGFSCNSLCPGTYTFCVTDASGCTCCSTVTVTFSTGISNPGLVQGFDVNPNPASDEITLTADFSAGTNATISVVNMLGEVVYHKKEIASGQVTEHIDMSGLPSGAYFVQIKTELGSTYRKVIKQ